METEIDDYIGQFTPQIQEILNKIRQMVRTNAPDALEKISYKIPSFHKNGIIIYYAAFKNHFSIFPPIENNPQLVEMVKPFANDKGNLRFLYKNPIDWDLLEQIIKHLIAENQRRFNVKTAL